MTPALHETPIGREFFTHNFPELIETLKDLVTVLKGDIIVISPSKARQIINFIKNLNLTQTSPLYEQSKNLLNYLTQKLNEK